ncbi:MAG: FAD-dependent oxidoreductase [bacterium]
MAKRRVLILGAGLAGLSAAWHLQRKGIDCIIFEKESAVGGLCRSKNIDGFAFDYCGHLLHFKQAYTFDLIKSLLGNNLLEHQRSAWVYSHGKYRRYPFQANLYGLPSSIIKECLLGFIQVSGNGHLKKKKGLNFLDWINNTFGKGIARHFMIPYNTKFWTVSPKVLTCEWLDGFIPMPSLSQIVEGTIEESQRQFGYNARFWYPKRGGIAQVPLAFASQIKNIYTNCQIEEINLDKKEIKMVSGNIERFDYLVSTIPLPEMPYLIKSLPKELYSLFKELRWNSIFNLNLGIERKDFSGRHWIYFPQKEICFFRVGFFHNFSPNLTSPDKSSLYVEVSYSKDKPIDKSDIVLRIKRDLKKVGILTIDDRVCAEEINDIKYGYPIYDNNYLQSREKILKFLLQNNIIPCGRYGSWRYMSMEDAILDGKEVADLLSKCLKKE